MTQTSPQAMPPSAQLLEMIFGFMLSRSIAVAAQFKIADLLKDGAKTSDEMAQMIGAHPRSLYRLLRALAGAGIFAEAADGRFSLTPLGELLRSDAPESLRGFAATLADEVNSRSGPTFLIRFRMERLLSRINSERLGSNGWDNTRSKPGSFMTR